MITVYNSTEDGKFADTDVTVNCDGHEYTVPAGTQIKLTPGEALPYTHICIMIFMWKKEVEMFF